MDRLAAMTAFVSVADLRQLCARSSPPRFVAARDDTAGRQSRGRLVDSPAPAHDTVGDLDRRGCALFGKSPAILTDVAEAENAARAEQSEPSGRFVVAAPNVFGRLEVAPLVCEFLHRHPAVTAELTLADRMVNLVDEGVDVAVRIGALSDSSLRVHSVGATRRVLVASPAYLKANKRLRHPQDLRAHTLIQFSALAHGTEWRFMEGAKEIRITLAPKFITNSADAAIGHAERDGGVTMALGYQVRERVRAGALQIILSKYEPPALPIQLVYPGTRHPSAAVRAFIDSAAKTRRWSFVDF